MRRRKRNRQPPEEPTRDPVMPVEPAVVVRILARDSGEVPYLDWYVALRDVGAKARITARIDRIRETGNFGDHRERISGAVSELRIDYGPGYRIYYVRIGDMLVLLAIGGTKDGQQDDIRNAVALWEECKSDIEGLSRDYVL